MPFVAPLPAFGDSSTCSARDLDCSGANNRETLLGVTPKGLLALAAGVVLVAGCGSIDSTASNRAHVPSALARLERTPLLQRLDVKSPARASANQDHRCRIRSP